MGGGGDVGDEVNQHMDTNEGKLQKNLFFKYNLSFVLYNIIIYNKPNIIIIIDVLSVPYSIIQ